MLLLGLDIGNHVLIKASTDNAEFHLPWMKHWHFTVHWLFLRHWCKCASILSSIYLPFLQTYNCCFCNSIWVIYFEKISSMKFLVSSWQKSDLLVILNFPWLLSYHNLISYVEVWESPTLLAVFSSHISSVCTFHLIKYLFKHSWGSNYI